MRYEIWVVSSAIWDMQLFADGSLVIMLSCIHMHIHEAGVLHVCINFYVTFLAQKSNQKTWRKLTRTVGLWVLGVLGCSSRTIEICSFGNELLSERCSDRYFRRWLCGWRHGCLRMGGRLFFCVIVGEWNFFIKRGEKGIKIWDLRFEIWDLRFEICGSFADGCI